MPPTRRQTHRRNQRGTTPRFVLLNAFLWTWFSYSPPALATVLKEVEIIFPAASFTSSSILWSNCLSPFESEKNSTLYCSPPTVSLASGTDTFSCSSPGNHPAPKILPVPPPAFVSRTTTHRASENSAFFTKTEAPAR